MPKAFYRILIVEDEKIMQDLLIARLSKEHIFQIYTANNGQEGLRAALNDIPDLILLDIEMPIMNGITMMKELKKDPQGKDVPIIFLTNYDTDENLLQEISKERPAYYLIKANISMDEVAKKVKESLGLVS